MDKAYIVTEGSSDKKILQTILPKDLQNNAVFISGSGANSAISIAKSLIINKSKFVILLLDYCKKVDPGINQDFFYLIENLKKYESGKNLKIFLFEPSLEDIFFKSINKKISKQNYRAYIEAISKVKENDKKIILKEKQINNFVRGFKKFMKKKE
jgi:hypothetical protein